MAVFTAEVIRKAPPMTYLRLGGTGFEPSDIEAIKNAMIGSNSTSLTEVVLNHNPGYFDNDSKVASWAAALKKHPGLKTLALVNCNVPDRSKTVL